VRLCSPPSPRPANGSTIFGPAAFPPLPRLPSRTQWANGTGTIVFIGATASRRGGAKTAAFASAKAAQRSLAQSLARNLGPLGIHVALAVIDGVIDSPQARSQLADKPDSFFLQPDAIAETVYFLTQ
jgi:NAD(P)-dependent dehydrogenase (short-subunit alcohol dehydrogenase family)